MTHELKVGTAVARRGEVVYGEFEALTLPSGLQERLPVIIASGREPGPTMWLTANIHGGELTGIAVIHRVVTAALCDQLRGAVVALPTLNPTGLQNGTRFPAYQQSDPNRQFPLPPKESTETGDEPEPPTMYEQLAINLFEEMRDKVDVLLDLHNASLQSIPFVIRDRILYRDDSARTEAEALQARLGEFAAAVGLTNLNEFKGKKYVKDKLHRSVAGIALNTLRVPPHP